MKSVTTLLHPWRVENISLRPFKGFYSFNPSIHRDADGMYRVLMRNCDYHAPNGVVMANRARGGKTLTRNAMAVLDPKTWQPITITEMRELDGLDRYPA